MPAYLQFRVDLQRVRPAIWREFLIRPGASFGDLHEAIQLACGWTNSHRYSFYAKALGPNPIAGAADEDDPGTPDAQRVLLSTHFGTHLRCLYLYDFGDGWEHEVSLEGEQDLPARFERRLIDGVRAFPPEDCGGVRGYEECVALIRKGTPDDAPERANRKWLGRWEPERFEFEKVAQQFDRPKAGKPRAA